MLVLPRLVESERLIVRSWTAADVDVLAEAVSASRSHLEPWLPWIGDEPVSRDRRAALIERWDQQWDRGGDAIYGIFLRAAPGSDAEGPVVGGAGLHRRLGPGALEIGYWVHAHHLRQGYATEAAWAVTDTAFDDPTVTRVEIHHDDANQISARIPFRLGFVDRGTHPEERLAPAETGQIRVWQTTRRAWRG